MVKGVKLFNRVHEYDTVDFFRGVDESSLLVFMFEGIYMHKNRSQHKTLICKDFFTEMEIRMSKKEDYEQRTEALLEPMVQEHNFELVDVEYVREGSNWFLRVFLDKEGGITIDDCELISRALSEKLDKEDYIDESYILEVSSPGLGRQLKKEKDFKRSIGEEVEVKLYKGIKMQRGKREVSIKEFAGILTAYDEDTVTLLQEDETSLELSRADIAIIRLAINF